MRLDIFPPRAAGAIPREETGFFAKMGFTGQVKFNDSHILIAGTAKDGAFVVDAIWDRHGKKPAYNFIGLIDEIVVVGRKLAKRGDGRYLLDGGLLHSRHAIVKDTIVLWDILVDAGVHLLGSTYRTRYDRLLELCGDDFVLQLSGGRSIVLGKKITDHIFVPLNYDPDSNNPGDPWHEIWGLVDRVNFGFDSPFLEGIMAKDFNGKLESGLRKANNEGWLGKSRVNTGRHRF